jgi:hypothetical protein
MTELGFLYYSGSLKGKTVNKYKINTDQFQKLADTLHWIHDLDEYKCAKSKEDIISYNIDDEYKEAYDKSQIKLKEAETEIAELKKQIEEMKLKTNLKTNAITRINKQICKQMNSDSDSDDDSDDDSDEENDESDDDSLSDDDDLGDLTNEYDDMAILLNNAIAFEEEE